MFTWDHRCLSPFEVQTGNHYITFFYSTNLISRIWKYNHDDLLSQRQCLQCHLAGGCGSCWGGLRSLWSSCCLYPSCWEEDVREEEVPVVLVCAWTSLLTIVTNGEKGSTVNLKAALSTQVMNVNWASKQFAWLKDTAWDNLKCQSDTDNVICLLAYDSKRYETGY